MSSRSATIYQCDRCGFNSEGTSGGGYEDDGLPHSFSLMRLTRNGLVREYDLCKKCADEAEVVVVKNFIGTKP